MRLSAHKIFWVAQEKRFPAQSLPPLSVDEEYLWVCFVVG
jgi:hypothetical protein